MVLDMVLQRNATMSKHRPGFLKFLLVILSLDDYHFGRHGFGHRVVDEHEKKTQISNGC